MLRVGSALLAAALLAGACVGSKAPAPAGLEAEPIAVQTPAVPDPGTASAQPPRAAAFELVAEPELPEAPEGAVCVVRGSGRPRAGCGDAPLLVSEARNGHRPLARVAPGGLPISWGFFDDGERAWLHAEARGVTVSGFSELADEAFSVRGDVPVLPGHVWLKDEAPIRVRGGVEAGVVSVSVRDDLDGLEKLAWKVSCEAVGYDPLPRRPATIGRSTPRSRFERAHPRRNRLRLHTAPQDQAFATLMGAGDTLYLPLDVVEVLGDWSRVRFDSYHMRFDVWVRTADIERGASGSIGRMVALCAAGTPLLSAKEHATLLADTQLAVGLDAPAATPSLTIAAGTEVLVDSRKRGLAKVVVAGPITPPPLAAFYVPESALVTSPR